ncbi:MAG: hypothetical protein PUP93_34260, partial [Rhizonema sp. NSF051]|nr:hypothetical protein [Rhizonema sp. NSF051]
CKTILYKKQIEHLYAQGIRLIGKGDFAEAIATFDEVLKIEPNIPEVLIQQGYAYGQLSGQLKQDPEKQELEKYYHVCKRATAIAPNFSGSWLCLGNSEQALKKYEDSIQSFDKTIGLACNSQMFMLLAIVLMPGITRANPGWDCRNQTKHSKHLNKQFKRTQSSMLLGLTKVKFS